MQSFAQPQRLLQFMHEPGITHQAIFECAVLIVGQSSDNVVLHPLGIEADVHHFVPPWIAAWPRISPIANSVSRSAFQKTRCSRSSLNRLRARKITRLKCSSDKRSSRQISSFASSLR